jgi:hypothetical protein
VVTLNSNILENSKLLSFQGKNVYIRYFHHYGELSLFLALRYDCPESYCHDPGVGVGVTPQGKNFNLGYIF